MLVTCSRWLVLVAGIVLCAGDLYGGTMVGSGNNRNATSTWQLTNSLPPFRVSNDGLVEDRAAVEFDLRDVLLAENTNFDAKLTLRGTIETEKNLFIYAYAGNGNIEVDDLLVGTLVSEIHLLPSAGLTNIDIDLSPFLNGLGKDRSEYGYLGFNLRESVSSGGVVTIEYLVLGTFLNVRLVTETFSHVQPVAATPEPATLAIWCTTAIGFAIAARRRRKS